jgi:hypothetical protein
VLGPAPIQVNIASVTAQLLLVREHRLPPCAAYRVGALPGAPAGSSSAHQRYVAGSASG